MPDNTAALWSAVAATFAAISSLLMVFIQRRNLLELVRPELILTGWSRRSEGQDSAGHEVIGFQSLKNVGRGVALHLHLHAFEEAGNCPIAALSTTRLPILACNETADVNGEIVVFWQNVKPQQGIKFLPITVTIFCLDSRGMRHETRYKLLAVELLAAVSLSDYIAPGVALTTRTTTTRAVWLLKLRSRFRGNLLFRRFKSRAMMLYSSVRARLSNNYG